MLPLFACSHTETSLILSLPVSFPTISCMVSPADCPFTVKILLTLARMPGLTKRVVAVASVPRAHHAEAPVAPLVPPSETLPSLTQQAKDICLDSPVPVQGVFCSPLFTENLH